MKIKILNLICGILIGLLLGFPLYASAGNIVVGEWEVAGGSYAKSVKTSLIKTDDGIYRVFIYLHGYAGGITAIKIK